MPSDHPFQQLFETFGKLPPAHSEEVNKAARETMKDWLAVPLGKPGHCILLKAPRAGHGKTHLLTRLQHELGGTHEFIPLHAIGGSRIDASTVLDDTLRRLVRSLPAAGGLTVLDLITRRLFSGALQPLVNSGEVPCQDREGALAALRTRPIETFDFHHPGAVTAHWARENFELLGPRLSLEMAQRNGLSLREVSFWVDAMFRFAATPIDSPGRSRALAATVFDDSTSDFAAHERLMALLGLVTSIMRVVLIADELEGFSSDESAALKLASFLGSMRQAVDKVDVVLSINQDVWESAFLPRLSGGLADRLSEVVIQLEPLDKDTMKAIIESRAPGDGDELLKRLGENDLPDHARGLIKRAGEAWQKAEAEHNNLQAGMISPEPEEAKEKPDAEPIEDEPIEDEPINHLPADEPSPASQVPAEEPAPSFAEPEQSKFSPEAAIAAFSATDLNEPLEESTGPEEVNTPPAFEPALENPFMAQSWPSPEVPEENPEKLEEVFSVNPSPAPDSFNPPVQIPTENPFQAPPAETPAQSFPQPPPNVPVQESRFQAAPPQPPIQQQPFVEEQSPVFQQAPPVTPPPAPQFEAFSTPDSNPEPSQNPFTAAPPHNESNSDGETDSNTDRVDDLLKQFRERYGKS